MGQLSALEDANNYYTSRFSEVEDANSDLISMYVASSRLHSTANYTDLIDRLMEIIVEMTGGERVALFLINPKERNLVMLANRGLDPAGSGHGAPQLGQGIPGRVAEQGELYVDEQSALHDTSDNEPIVCIPLKIEDRVLGVIAVYKFFVQKKRFVSLDFDIFDLLSTQAGFALFGTKLYGLHKHDNRLFGEFLDFQKKRPKLQAPTPKAEI